MAGTSPSEHQSRGRLAGRVYLVTGAAAGLGRAVSLGFAREGAVVVLLDRSMEGLEAVYDEIQAAGGPQAAIFALDLEGAGPEDYTRLAETLETELGRLDGLVHAAGRLGPLTPLDQYPPAEWSGLLQTHLTGPFLLTQACLPVLERAGDPSVTFVSDGVGVEPTAYWGAYAVSKAALEAFARILAEENEGASLRVNTVEPGAIRTALQQDAFPAADPDRRRDPAELLPLFLELAAPAGPPRRGERLSPADLPLR